MTTKELLNSFKREEGIALFNTKKTDKEVYDILVSKGLTDDFETFISETQKIFNEKFSKMSANEILKEIEGAELTDDQLEMIAGGAKDGEASDAAAIAAVSASAVVVSVAGAAGAI